MAHASNKTFAGLTSTFTIFVWCLLSAALAWCIPGGGHLLLKEPKRSLIIFVTVTVTFVLGLYVGSFGVIDPVGGKWWFMAQIMATPAVAVLGDLTANSMYPVYGKPLEIGQIYTSVAGLLNLLCIINACYLTYLQKTYYSEGQDK